MSNEVTIDDLYNRGVAQLAAEHTNKEVAKVGTLRGGSTGAMVYKNTAIGTCPRRAYLRYKGISEPKEYSTRNLMFEAGLSNEDIWADVMRRGLPEGYSLLREEEIPVSWATSNGTKVTGRPDIVLCYKGVPQRGIELKLVSSVWTAKSVLVDGAPKLGHLLQSAHYARKLNLPWELWYTNRADFSVSRESWQQKLFSKLPPEYGEYRDYTKDGVTRTELNKILPFRVGYEISWDNDQLIYRKIGGDGSWKHSIITWKGINDYFETVSTIDTRGVLPPRPTNMSALGKEEGYDMCNPMYCPLSGTCDAHEVSLKKWLAAADELTK